MQADIERLYMEAIGPLPAPTRLELLARIAKDLAAADATSTPHERSLLQLEGVGAAMWAGVDAQAYINELRGEWEGRG